MLRWILVIVLLVVNGLTGETNDNLPTVFYNQGHYVIEGTSIPCSLKENAFDRLPEAYKNKVRGPVWDLSKNSAGLSVRFVTNSSRIVVRWELLNDFSMNHMADTGIKGLDLYVNTGKTWQYVNTARPINKINESVLLEKMSDEMREYRLFLPLYDGLVQLEIGIDSLSLIERPEKWKSKPIVFYGTSITQGGCASRPGMAYPAIISRKLGVECINFGFSGNGRMEAPIIEVMTGIDAEFYVIDCLPNMTAEQVMANTRPLVQKIREKRVKTPIIFIDNIMYEKAYFNEESQTVINEKNRIIREEVSKMVDAGYQNIHIIGSKNSLGSDHEGTVDGVHFTDLGFMRFADFLIDNFARLKLIKKVQGKS